MRRLAAPVLLAAAVLVGCGGISDPYNDAPVRTAAGPAQTTAAGADASPAGEEALAVETGVGASAPDLPEALDRTALSRSAAAAIERYSDLTGTWTWRDVVAKFRAAARISVGQARERMLTSAVQIPAATTYQTNDLRQTTTIEAIVARAGASDRRARYLVVQRRRIEMRETPPSNQWFVSLVTLQRVGDRWVVAVWEELV